MYRRPFCSRVSRLSQQSIGEQGFCTMGYEGSCSRWRSGDLQLPASSTTRPSRSPKRGGTGPLNWFAIFPKLRNRPEILSARAPLEHRRHSFESLAS